MNSQKLLNRHESIRRIRYRGMEVPPHLATLAYLKNLEMELADVRALLDAAWGLIDTKDFRKCSNHLDRAQQRLHRTLKRIARKI
jgi:hypothetical protein